VSERQEPEGRIDSAQFEDFFARSERPLRFALSARFGFDVGREAAAEAMAYAWEHWGRISGMDNPAGYVYRVGARHGRKMSTPTRGVGFEIADTAWPSIEPALGPALSELSHRQRASVVLVHGMGWTYQETAELLGLTRSSVQRHVDRGVAKLRRALGVDVEP
jgi:RNA polymerase sigma-70 factor (ECF subfamily)